MLRQEYSIWGRGIAGSREPQSSARGVYGRTSISVVSSPPTNITHSAEAGTDGKNKYRKAVVGTVEALANEASALKAARALRLDANQETPQARTGPSTVAMLVAHCSLEELAGDRKGSIGNSRHGWPLLAL